MSYCCINSISSDGAIQAYKTYKNAWGGAAYIWEQLSQTYLGESWVTFYDQKYKPLWDLIDDARLRRFEKIVFLSTFDFAIIRKSDFLKVANAYTRFSFSNRYNNPMKVKICWLNEWASALRNMVFEDDIIGACFYHTSVSQNYWENYNIEEKDNHFDIIDDVNRMTVKTTAYRHKACEKVQGVCGLCRHLVFDGCELDTED
jgi:hypothetical protein